MSLDDLALLWAWYDSYAGEMVEWLMTGRICATIADYSLGSQGGHKPADFMPRLHVEAPTQEELEDKIERWVDRQARRK